MGQESWRDLLLPLSSEEDLKVREGYFTEFGIMESLQSIADMANQDQYYNLRRALIIPWVRNG